MEHLPGKLPADPMPLLKKWLAVAEADKKLANPHAMTLATANECGAPSARVVLCKEVSTDPAYLVFYTNYESTKGREIETNPWVAGAFHWDHLDMQIRFGGTAIKSPTEESDAYFATRDKESQISAWASAQSQPLANRKMMKDKQVVTLQKLAKMAEKSGKNNIPRPPCWGGYRIWLSSLEFWTRGAARLHDRARWHRRLGFQGDAFNPDDWKAYRLQP
jgi:pyridoxamine 5'-phosphate oxidase